MLNELILGRALYCRRARDDKPARPVAPTGVTRLWAWNRLPAR